MPCMDLLFWCRLWTEVDSRNCPFLMLLSYFGGGHLFVYGGGHLFVYGGDPFSRLRIRYCHFYSFISWKNWQNDGLYFEYLLTLITCLKYFKDQILLFLLFHLLKNWQNVESLFWVFAHFNYVFGIFWEIHVLLLSLVQGLLIKSPWFSDDKFYKSNVLNLRN